MNMQLTAGGVAAKPPMTVRQLDELTYEEKLRHWMRKDAWNPGGMRLHMRNAEIARSAISMQGGHIVKCPLIVGRPCFGIPTAYLQYRDEKRYVRGVGLKPAGRCSRCKLAQACAYVVERRLSADPKVMDAWTDWLRADGPRAFQRRDPSMAHARRLWAVLYRELRAHPFTSVNDTAVVAHYANDDQQRRERDRKRHERDRLFARRRGIVSQADLIALGLAAFNRRVYLCLARRQSDCPPALARLPERSVEELIDVWEGRAILILRRMKPNAPNIARWLVENWRSNRSSNPAALATRVSKDLKRLADLQAVRWRDAPLLPQFDSKRELDIDKVAIAQSGHAKRPLEIGDCGMVQRA